MEPGSAEDVSKIVRYPISVLRRQLLPTRAFIAEYPRIKPKTFRSEGGGHATNPAPEPTGVNVHDDDPVDSN